MDQQDRKQHDQQNKENTGCVHGIDLSLRVSGVGTFRSPAVDSWATAGCASDRLRAFCHNQHSQYGCCIADVSRNRQRFRYGHMLLRQCLKPRADTHGADRLGGRSLQKAWADRIPAEKPKVGELQMDWLRSEDLKEEKDVTAPTFIVAGTKDQN